MKISIIVPVYKVEPYIRRCVDSILAQTFTDFELILVDDGSPDGCPAICDEYAEKDSRVKVIHKENGGLSDARNAGLDIAQGAYIGFVDSDDWIHPEMYERMMSAAALLNADIVCCGRTEFSEDNDERLLESVNKESVICYERKDFLSNLHPVIMNQITPTVWDKLYRVEIFSDIRFPAGLISEDLYIQLQSLYIANRIAIIKEPLYCYRIRKGSITHSGYKPEWVLATVNLFQNDLAFLVKLGEKELLQYYLDESLVRFFRDYFAVEFLNPEFKSGFAPLQKTINHYFFQFLFCPKICKMSKLMLVLRYINPKLSLMLAKKNMPHCVYWFMR